MIKNKTPIIIVGNQYEKEYSPALLTKRLRGGPWYANSEIPKQNIPIPIKIIKTPIIVNVYFFIDKDLIKSVVRLLKYINKLTKPYPVNQIH